MEKGKYWFPCWQDNNTDDNTNDDTKSSRKEVDIGIPKYLIDCRPIANQTCYLHVININAKYAKPKTHPRQICAKFLTSLFELGIITRHEIPEVCNFPAFSDLGEVEIDIQTNYRSWKLTEHELLAASKFHRILFQKVIPVVPKCLIYSDRCDEPMGYFVVPLKADKNGWLQMESAIIFQQWDVCDVKEPSMGEREEKSYDYPNYFGSVILPWYLKNCNSKGINYHLVTDVNEKKTMNSPFPNKKYSSYADYYEKVHNLKSFHPNQPLLEVRPMPLNNLNCLRPRSEKIKAKDQEQHTYLVPEFCTKIHFPACYWYKATILPTVLHRLHYLLLAEELRRKIVLEGHIGALEWDKGPNDVLEIYEKYDFRKTESSCKPVNFLSKLPSLLTLQKYTNYQGPRQNEIFEALTPKGCNDILDLERLEILGDSFLKFATTVDISVKYNTANEGELTFLKNELIGNRNLMCCGSRLNLESCIKINTFSIQNWIPPGFVMPDFFKKIRKIVSPSFVFHIDIPFVEQFSGSLSENTMSNAIVNIKKFLRESDESIIQKEESALLFYGKQFVGEKTIADVVEALIGLYFKTGGVQSANQLLKYFGILKPNNDEIMGSRVLSPMFDKSKCKVEDFVPNWKKLEKILNYEFREKAYIVQALSHPTYLVNNMTDSYQTLEFLGDAVLDILITSYIYQYCGDLPPGKITDLRASLVNNITFGALCVKFGFQKFLLSDDRKLTDVIDHFTNYQERRNHKIYGNNMVSVCQYDNQMAEEIKVPKVLGDIFESLAGAIFLDSGHDLNEVWRVYYNMMKKEIKQFSKKIPINPVRAVYEIPGVKVDFVTETLDSFAEKKIVKLNITRNKKKSEYFGKGENTDNAKRAAAKLALEDFGRTGFFI